MTATGRPAKTLFSLLSADECLVVQGILAGYSNKAISASHGWSRSKVARLIRSVKDTWGAQNKVDIANLAYGDLKRIAVALSWHQTLWRHS
jgi:DNA-binding NarL/FixJ family response regulator